MRLVRVTNSKAARIFVAAVLLSLSDVAARAGEVAFSFNPPNTYSGTAAAGSLTADFLDVAGGVQLTITSNLAAGENLQAGKALYFNFNPSKDSTLDDLTFALTANTAFSQAAVVEKGADSYRAGPSFGYDILFTYSSSTKAFTGGQSQTYLITDSGGPISAGDFNFLNEGSGPAWLAAVHIQNTPSGGNGSAWDGATAVPEPTSIALFGTILLLAGFVLRRQFAAA